MLFALSTLSSLKTIYQISKTKNKQYKYTPFNLLFNTSTNKHTSSHIHTVLIYLIYLSAIFLLTYSTYLTLLLRSHSIYLLTFVLYLFISKTTTTSHIMFFLTSLIKSFILVLLSYSQFVSSAALVSQSIPKGLYHECNGGGFLELCSNTISEAWQYGRLTSFTQEHQFFTGSTTPCKITYWTSVFSFSFYF